MIPSCGDTASFCSGTADGMDRDTVMSEVSGSNAEGAVEASSRGRSLRTVSHALLLEYYLAVPAAPGRLNTTKLLGLQENPILLSGRCCMAHTAIFTGTGAIFSYAVRGFSRVICG